MKIPTFSEAYRMCYKDLIPIYEFIGSKTHNLMDYLDFLEREITIEFCDSNKETMTVEEFIYVSRRLNYEFEIEDILNERT